MSNDDSEESIELYAKRLAEEYDQLFGVKSVKTRQRSLGAMKRLKELTKQGDNRFLRRLQFLDLLIAFEERALSEIDLSDRKDKENEEENANNS